jgi:CelD/BcsL family acetyltransferase involved in cellulose biosynthesis
VGRVGRQVVLIAPMMTAGPFLRVLGSEFSEFHDVLVLPGPQRDNWLGAALKAFEGLGVSGLLLRDSRQDSDLGAFLEQHKAGRSRVAGKTSFIRLDEFADWDAYLASLPTHLKSDQRRQWKRLAELSEPGRFEFVEDAGRRLELLAWLFAQKSKWVETHKGVPDGGVFGSGSYRDFLFAIVPVLGAQGQIMMCRIVSGRETLAGLLAFVHRDYFTFFIFGYDPKWSSYSPGRLVMAKAIEWCFDRKMRVFDMLQGPEEYKAIWSTHSLPVRDYYVPLSFQGHVIEKWHDSGCSNFFAKPWFGPVSQIAPGQLRRMIGGRLAAQRELISEMRPL